MGAAVCMRVDFWSQGTSTEVVTHTRADGAVVTLLRDSEGFWRVTVTRDGAHVQAPHDALPGTPPRTMFLRRAAEPVILDAGLLAALRSSLKHMRGLKAKECDEIERMITEGLTAALAFKLEGFAPRKGSDAAVALVPRLRAAHEAALTALPAALRAQVAAVEATARR